MSANQFPDGLTNAIPTIDSPGPSPEKLRKLVGIAVSMLAAPFILWGVWILVRDWGVWRVRSATPGLHHIRTWHGWVEAEKYAERIRKRQTRGATFRSDRFSTGSTAEFHRVVRGPTRERRGVHAQGRRKSILHFLPSWTKIDDDGSALDATTTPDILSTAEEGRLSNRLFRGDAETQYLGLSFTGYQYWPRARRAQDVNAQLTAGPCYSRLPISRNCRVTYPPEEESNYGNRRPWWIRGHRMTPASCSLHPIPAKLNGISVESDVPSEPSALVLTPENLRPPRTSAITHGIANRTFSLPAIFSSSKHQRVKRWVSEPDWLESSSSLSVATPKLYPARNPEGPVTPHNSDELPGSCSATPQRRHSRSDLGQVEFTARENFAQNLRERLIVWAKPLVLNPYKSTGREYDGTDGRPSSPSMGWLVRSESAMVSSASFDRENWKEISIRRSARSGCSTRSSTSLDRISVFDARSRASDGEQPTTSLNSTGSFGTCQSYQSTRHNTKGSCSSDSAFQGNYSPGKLRLISSLLPYHRGTDKLARKWSSLPTRRIQVSSSGVFETQSVTLTEKSRIDQNPDFWSVKDNSLKLEAGVTQLTLGESAPSNSSDHPLLWESAVGSAITPVPDPCLRYKSWASRLLDRHHYPQARPEPINPRSTPAEVFLDDLDRRLNRLNYELCPGFRGPRSREAARRSRWQVVPYHFSILDGMSQQPIINARPDPSRLLELPPATPIATDVQPKKLEPRNDDASVEARGLIYPKILRVSLAAAATTINDEDEPREGAMDTAAWIPRRPPMCARRSRTAEQALLYTDGRVTKPKPLAAWQQLGPRGQRHGLRRHLKLRQRAGKKRKARAVLSSAKPRGGYHRVGWLNGGDDRGIQEDDF